MKITLLSDDSVRFDADGDMLTVEAQTADQSYSPFHMMASGLAVCTYSVLQSWAQHAKLETDGLIIDVAWSFAEAPHRVGEYRVDITWPSLPPARAAAAERVAAMCPVKTTLLHAPAIHTRVAAGVTDPTGKP